MTFHLKVGGSAASETDIIEGRVVHQESAIRTESSLHSTYTVQTIGAVITPCSARVSFASQFASVRAGESNVVDGRVVRRVAIRQLSSWADSHPETLHIRSCDAFPDGLPISKTT